MVKFRRTLIASGVVVVGAVVLVGCGGGSAVSASAFSSGDFQLCYDAVTGNYLHSDGIGGGIWADLGNANTSALTAPWKGLSETANGADVAAATQTTKSECLAAGYDPTVDGTTGRAAMAEASASASSASASATAAATSALTQLAGTWTDKTTGLPWSGESGTCDGTISLRFSTNASLEVDQKLVCSGQFTGTSRVNRKSMLKVSMESPGFIKSLGPIAEDVKTGPDDGGPAVDPFQSDGSGLTAYSVSGNALTLSLGYGSSLVLKR